MYNHHEICKNYQTEVSYLEKDHLCIEFRWHARCIRLHKQAGLIILLGNQLHDIKIKTKPTFQAYLNFSVCSGFKDR